MTPTFVHTLGDSTLDNLYWLLNGQGSNLETAKNESVEGQLQTKLGDQFQVISHAYDGFTTESILDGDSVARVLSWGVGLKFETYIKEKLKGSSAHAFPLQELYKKIGENPNARHYVILSVGGNDFRENLANPKRLFGDISKIQGRYLKILNSLLHHQNVFPILMFQYRTDVKNDPYHIYTILKIAGYIVTAVNLIAIILIARAAAFLVRHKMSYLAGSIYIAVGSLCLFAGSSIAPFHTTFSILRGRNAGLAMIGGLMEKFYRPILEQAYKSNLPILDLPNSFNPNERLYISGIEPNKEGGKIISTGLRNIIQGCSKHGAHEYKFSKIYRTDGLAVHNCPDRWYVE